MQCLPRLPPPDRTANARAPQGPKSVLTNNVLTISLLFLCPVNGFGRILCTKPEKLRSWPNWFQGLVM